MDKEHKLSKIIPMVSPGNHSLPTIRYINLVINVIRDDTVRTCIVGVGRQCVCTYS